MRYAELTALPGTPEEARNTIIDVVTVYNGRNASEIPMSAIIDTLHDSGYDITPRMVMDVLQGNEAIKRISKDTVYLKSDEADMGSIPDQEKEKAEKHVEKMAKKAIKTNSRKI